MTELGTTETKLDAWVFPAPAKWLGKDIVDADRRFSFNDGVRIRFSGASALAGTGNLTVKLYRGSGDDGTDATELAATYGPYSIADLKAMEKRMDYLRFPPTSEPGNVFVMSLTSDAAAATAYTAGTLQAVLEFD